jgi:hypothetical protein
MEPIVTEWIENCYPVAPQTRRAQPATDEAVESIVRIARALLAERELPKLAEALTA